VSTNRDYQLRREDLIEVKVYGEDELTARVRLDGNGTVDLPLLPGVSLNALTQPQACERIRALYMKDFLFDPMVSLTILEYSKSKVTVLGQVRTPGVYLFPANERLNLLQAIALAGGYTRTGEPGKIIIKRVQNGRQNVIKVDGRAMAKEEGYKMFEIQPDDLITIAESLW
jgi:polysaccharide export outer membrane protein